MNDVFASDLLIEQSKKGFSRILIPDWTKPEGALQNVTFLYGCYPTANFYKLFLGTTYIGRALDSALKLLETRRGGVPIVVVLISDGYVAAIFNMLSMLKRTLQHPERLQLVKVSRAAKKKKDP